ncbi:hypothetical protein V1502_20235 [Bacillus sp. SCS-153A]|uniref:hypothetical protein n=1 Tax=Rossellomorea sedimentorum TaxID=3115294 RepID=UPI0039065DB4
MKKLGISIISSMMMLTACGTSSNNAFEVIEKSASVKEEKKPTLHVETKEEGDKVLLIVETDLVISKENYGKEKVSGQGHIHVYVNNGEKQGVTEFPYELKDLDEGLNQVKVSLHNNDHTPYGVSRKLEIHY